MVVALWGILKAGGAYVPDPKYPKERLDFIVADAGIEVPCLTRSGWSTGLLPRRRIDLSGYGLAAILHRSQDPDVQVSSEDLAYLITRLARRDQKASWCVTGMS